MYDNEFETKENTLVCIINISIATSACINAHNDLLHVTFLSSNKC